MQDSLPYSKRHSYPHLSPGEAAIWERYIDANPDKFLRCWYDVPLGTPRGFDPTRPEPYRSHHAYLGGYKIDVLCENADGFAIIELKKCATTKALGEVWMYSALWERANQDKKPPALEIVTDEEMPHMREVCEAEGVSLIVLPFAPSAEVSPSQVDDTNESDPKQDVEQELSTSDKAPESTPVVGEELKHGDTIT